MKIVQLAIPNSEYIQALEKLLPSTAQLAIMAAELRLPSEAVLFTNCYRE